MKILVVGGGGREHAIIQKLKENKDVEKIYALPGNGGIAADAICVPEIGAKDIPAIVAFARGAGIDYAVVAPDDPLVLGCVDALAEAGIPSYTGIRNCRGAEVSKRLSARKSPSVFAAPMFCIYCAQKLRLPPGPSDRASTFHFCR